MALVSVRGVQIQFPYQPYKVQEDYMEKVIECLQQGVNGILESPTGTGKTLSLLCSTLAWLESRKAQQQLLMVSKSSNNEAQSPLIGLQSQVDNAAGIWSSPNFLLPKIIYSSRTHTQLSQAAQELKRTSYRHVRSVVLGSREQLCLHPEVSKIQNHSAKVFACRSKINSKSCPFYFNVDEKILSQKDYEDTPVMDIEDVITLGKKHTCCPYYATRNLKAKADLLFSPYNYIIDPKTRRSQGIELEGNIVIFDEAHNIENACEESMSFQLRSIDLASCINEVTQTISIINQVESHAFSSSDSGAPNFTLTDLSILKVMFCELEEHLDAEVAQNTSGVSKPGDYMIDILSKVELVPQKAEIVIQLLDKICLYHSMSATSPLGSKGAGLQKFCDIIKILFSRAVGTCTTHDLKKEYSRKYRVYLQYDVPKKSSDLLTGWATASTSNSKKQSWKLDCWCFSPGIGMQDVVSHGVHSVLLTSGTLSPLRPLICELGISFPVQLESPHIISDKQVFVAVVSQGPDGSVLNSSYQNRFNEKYVNSLGRAISNFCRIIPNGVLAFFPSYTVMKSNVKKWEELGIWQSLSAIKPVFVEPQGKDAFQESIVQFYTRINDPEGKGATLLAVCRGKVSEGLDFTDKNARGVIITGLPFPPSMDARVKLKMDYLNATAKENKGLYGTEWYMLQASRAINQAIGRVIRHKDDYGAILLCDNRFAEKRIQSQLSRWVQGRIKVFDSFGPSLKHLSSFFKELEQNPCKPKMRQQNTSLYGFNVGSSYSALKESIGKKSSPGQVNSEEKLDETSIFAGYLKTEERKSGQAASYNSIFDALDQYEASDASSKPCASHFNESKVELLQTTSKTTADAPENFSRIKKRKINIQLRGIDQPESSSSKVSERESWKMYLKEVKSILSTPELYARFCSSIKEFRAGKNISVFAEQICAIFSSVPDRNKYLEKTSMLVNSQERSKFMHFCSLSKF